jgi:sugar-specific transcriptional regulator TrmB
MASSYQETEKRHKSNFENRIIHRQNMNLTKHSPKEIEGALSELGLNKYEARAYLALVTEGSSTAKNVSDITGIPYGKVYEVIDSLVMKGFVMTLPTKPMKCKALSPADAINSAKKNLHKRLKTVEHVILTEIEPLFAQNKNFTEPRGIFWILTGRAAINKKMEELGTAAKHHINIFTSGNGIKRMESLKPILKAASKRGVKIYLSGAISKECLEDIKNFDFCELKHTDMAHSQLFSVDGKEAMLIEPIPDDSSPYYGRDLGVWMLNEKFVKCLEQLFISHFNNSKNINERVEELSK